ncbi:hybrid sensor histidine kinase/response regulator [Brevundimonas sp.]|uniref:hybrid sensor histidine kinase/response regulator n=1 Tax=Brevundimonas sp. TaxID=1871086 RepID=UPI0028A13CEB|nr:hybrid sensor histidine kinase/response regulator [Brevundimonas sp.]
MSDIDDPINVLLVDDLEENLLALEALLKRDGLTFLKARSGDEALELLLVHEVALALLDVQMPGMDGFQLAEFMRGTERVRHVPIIFVTAGSTDARRRFQGYEAGAVDFIQKPIEADILRSKAEVFFDLYRHRREVLIQRDTLSAYADTLREADLNKNQFLAVLGHELRNPVMALKAGLELMERRGAHEGSELIRQRMRVQVSQLGRLVDDLLDITRIDQGKIELRREMADLGAVLEAAVDGAQHKIEMGGHDFHFHIPDNPVLMEIDAARITQVIGNLIGNAAKYTPRGGRIGVKASVEDEAVIISVSDNGIGIPRDMQGKVFELYAQLQGPDSRSKDGLGIGLALVKQIVELHGGSISVASEGSGAGSVFNVRLPMISQLPE